MTNSEKVPSLGERCVTKIQIFREWVRLNVRYVQGGPLWRAKTLTPLPQPLETAGLDPQVIREMLPRKEQIHTVLYLICSTIISIEIVDAAKRREIVNIREIWPKIETDVKNSLEGEPNG